MPSNVGALTAKRKANLNASGTGRNSMQRPGLKPSGPDFAGYLPGGEFLGTTTEAWVSLVGGAALTTFAVLELLNRKSKLVNGLVAVVGGGLVFRGISGLLSPLDGMTEDETGMENPAASVQHLEGIKVEQSILIDRPARELYSFWRNFSNLPKIMSNLESVEVIDEQHSHWVAKAPLGMSVEWDAEVYIEHVGEMISWRSVEGSEVETAGSVHFIPEGNGTRVTVMMKVDPPGGMLGVAAAKLFGDDPSSEVKKDLKNFKKMMESGDVGSSNGSNGSLGYAGRGAAASSSSQSSSGRDGSDGSAAPNTETFGSRKNGQSDGLH